jgi:hypothetical protein
VTGSGKVMRVFGAMLALLLGSLLVTSLSGCGSGSEDDIRASVKKTFTSLKNGHYSLIQTDSTELSDAFGQVGVSLDEAYYAVQPGFDYQVNRVNVSGSKAEVNIDVTAKDYTSICESYQSRIQTWATSEEAMQVYAEGGTEALSQHCGEILLEVMGDPSIPSVTNNVSLTYAKTSGTWGMTGEAKDKLSHAIFGMSSTMSISSLTDISNNGIELAVSTAENNGVQPPDDQGDEQAEDQSSSDQSDSNQPSSAATSASQ